MEILGQEITLGWAKRHACRHLRSNWLLAKPILKGLPAFLLVYYKHPNFKTALDANLPKWLATIANTYEPWLTALAVIMTVAMLWSIPSTESDEIKAPGQMLISLEKPVSEKAYRHANFVEQKIAIQGRQLGAGRIPLCTAECLALMDPKTQLEKILEALEDFLRKTTIQSRKGIIKAVLFILDRGAITDKVFWPRDARPTVSNDMLMSYPTAAKRAYTTEEAVWITDVSKAIQYSRSLSPGDMVSLSESELMFIDPSQDEKRGSLLCYPICVDYLQGVRMILSIFVKRPGVFDESNLEYYTTMLKPFEKRLKLEYSAHLIKERADV